MANSARYSTINHSFFIPSLGITAKEFNSLPVGKRIPIYRQLLTYKKRSRHVRINFSVGKLKETLQKFVEKHNVTSFYYTYSASTYSNYCSDTSVDFFYTQEDDPNINLDLKKK